MYQSGANRGIGYEIAAALLRSTPTPPSDSKASGSPYHIYLASRSHSNGAAALDTVPSSPNNTVSVLPLDVTSAASIASAVSTIQSEVGRLDVLINNAGIVSTAADTVSRLRETLEANLIAPYALTDACKGLLLSQPADDKSKSKSKRIINITSDLGSIAKRTDPTDPLYNSPFPEYRVSKAALNMMTACRNVELAKQGVKVFAFNPGFTITALTGEEQVEMRREEGAREPRVVGEACVRVVQGERDGELGRLLDVEGGALPW